VVIKRNTLAGCRMYTNKPMAMSRHRSQTNPTKIFSEKNTGLLISTENKF